MVNKILPDIKIKDLKHIDLAITATDLNRGSSVSFNRYNDCSLRDAVLASICLPALFPTKKIYDTYFVDGGIFNNTPLRDALMLGSKNIIVVELKPKEKETYLREIQTNKKYKNVYDVTLRLLELALDRMMYEDVKKAKKLNKIIRCIRKLEKLKAEPELIQELKESINYEKNNRIKSIVRINEIAPSKRLEPPGTLGFDDIESIRKTMDLGKKDALTQLASSVIV